MKNEIKFTSYNENKLNELSENVKTILAKGFTNDVRNKSFILNRAKYFFHSTFQDYLCQPKIPINPLVALIRLIRENLKAFQLKILEIFYKSIYLLHSNAMIKTFK